MGNGAEIGFAGAAQMDAGNAVRVVRCVCMAGFSLFLLVFSWQDLHRKRIRVSWLYGFGAAGMTLTLVRCAVTVLKDGWNLKQSIMGMAAWLLGLLPGAFLLWMEHHTRGAVGLGDACFFLITGCYLGGWRTLELLVGTVFVSSLVGGIWMLIALFGAKGSGLWGNMRNKKLPFLPCVIPVWIWMVFAAPG